MASREYELYRCLAHPQWITTNAGKYCPHYHSKRRTGERVILIEKPTEAKVWLLWDKSREENGEAPELADVFASRESAQLAAVVMCDFLPGDGKLDVDLTIEGQYSIEEREVRT